ncbi:hypothetical protein GGR24_001154 [Hansschlegelia beijingensis]|uniref:Uncharacterized protein n=1 Tax=Hansschlegelia beijingensis TaxID=1133344 RepID=A0A7W6D0R0_9HYPH|nr:hypothetical protein [Hansschlegelia beijingensis]
MGSRYDEACAAVGRRQASEAVFVGTIDASENSIPSLIINRLSRRFAVSAAVAALVVELAGLGPQEARR